MVLANARHEAFALGLAEGKSQERSYIDAGFSPNGASGSACKLLQDRASISERVREILTDRDKLRQSGVVAAERSVSLTLVGHLEKLAELRDRAIDGRDWSAAISAEHKRGLASGFYVTRTENGRPGEFADLSISELQAKLESYRVILRASERRV